MSQKNFGPKNVVGQYCNGGGGKLWVEVALGGRYKNFRPLGPPPPQKKNGEGSTKKNLEGLTNGGKGMRPLSKKNSMVLFVPEKNLLHKTYWSKYDFGEGRKNLLYRVKLRGQR